MENEFLFGAIAGTSSEKSSIFEWDPFCVNSDLECIDTELDKSAIYTEADSQLLIEIAPCMVEKDENKKQGSLFAPFSHQMKPDPEYARLVSERSASNQEAFSKLINDRYKWIMESAALRKEKEQNIREFAKKSTESSNIIDSKEVVNTTHLSITAVNDTEKTAQLLHNLHITPDSLTKDHSEKICDNQHEMIYWHMGLNRFIKLNFGEINTKANISSFDMLKTETRNHEHRVEDALKLMRNEQRDGENRMTFIQESQKLGKEKCRKNAHTFYDGHEGISSTCEDHLIEKSKGQCER